MVKAQVTIIFMLILSHSIIFIENISRFPGHVNKLLKIKVN